MQQHTSVTPVQRGRWRERYKKIPEAHGPVSQPGRMFRFSKRSFCQHNPPSPKTAKQQKSQPSNQPSKKLKQNKSKRQRSSWGSHPKRTSGLHTYMCAHAPKIMDINIHEQGSIKHTYYWNTILKEIKEDIKQYCWLCIQFCVDMSRPAKIILKYMRIIKRPYLFWGWWWGGVNREGVHMRCQFY